MDLTPFAGEVGQEGPVTISGASTRGGAVPGVRTVIAPAGIEWIQPDEMTLCCGAATPVAALDEALADHGQMVALPPTGTVGGALACGHSGLRRLGYGPVREVLLQTRYISAAGEVVTAGGPTVKNVSGFDLCRLLVGSRGTLGFLGEVIVRTRPKPACSHWFHLDGGPDEPNELLAELYRPTSVLWDGRQFWVLLEGQPADIEAVAATAGLVPVDGPPRLEGRHRWSIAPSQLACLTGDFVAEVGVGIVHHREPPPRGEVDPALRVLTRRVKARFDRSARLNPGVDVLALADGS